MTLVPSITRSQIDRFGCFSCVSTTADSAKQAIRGSSMYIEDNLRYYRTATDINQLTNQIQCRPTIRAIPTYLSYVCFSDLLLLHLLHLLTSTEQKRPNKRNKLNFEKENVLTQSEPLKY